MSDSNDPRDAAKLSGDEQLGHGLEGRRTPVERTAHNQTERGGHIDGAPEDGDTGVTRTSRSGGDTSNQSETGTRTARPSGTREVGSDPYGNSSETSGNGDTTGTRTTRTAPGTGTNVPTGTRTLPIGPGQGCVRTTGTMMIASVFTIAAVVRQLRR